MANGYWNDYPSTRGFFWWNTPVGWTDLDLYDYNNNLMLDDEEIADLVADNITANPYIPASDQRRITVEVNDGVVTLSGEVRNPRSKPLAYADAFWSSGVLDVVSNIKIKPMKRKQEEEQGQREQQTQR